MGDMANNVGFCLNRAKLFLIIRKDYLTMTPKFDGYAAQYDAWFMENENLFHSELRLFQKVLGDIAGKRVLSVAVALRESNLREIWGQLLRSAV